MNDLLRRLADLLLKRPKLVPVKVPTEAQRRAILNERLYEMRQARRFRNHY
jgi:hypothetical protein